MLASILALTALAASAGAAPTERQNQYWPGLPEGSPSYRISCYNSYRCPQGGGGAAYSLDVNNSLTTGCTQLPAGIHSCRLERFPVEGGVPEGNACTLSLFWRHNNGQCANKIMDMDPLTWQWSWNCGSAWGADIQGYSVDCSQASGGQGVNRFSAPQNTKGENAEAEYGIGGE